MESKIDFIDIAFRRMNDGLNDLSAGLDLYADIGGDEKKVEEILNLLKKIDSILKNLDTNHPERYGF